MSLSLVAALGLVYAPVANGSYTSRALTAPSPTAEVLPHVDLGRVTYYNAVPGQTDSTPNVSACGPNLERQVAVSRDLFRRDLHCGDVVEVWLDGEGYLGEFTVWDTMHPRFELTLDILTKTSYTWGKTTGHLIVVD